MFCKWYNMSNGWKINLKTTNHDTHFYELCLQILYAAESKRWRIWFKLVVICVCVCFGYEMHICHGCSAFLNYLIICVICQWQGKISANINKFLKYSPLNWTKKNWSIFEEEVCARNICNSNVQCYFYSSNVSAFTVFLPQYDRYIWMHNRKNRQKI